MPAKHKTLSVYPDPTALAVVGGNSPSCNRAIEGWARIIRDHQPELARDEWCLIADALNGTLHDAGWDGRMLAAEIADGIALDGLAEKWFKRAAAAAGKRLVEKLAAMEYPAVQALLVAVAWVLANREGVAMDRDEWWLPSFRVARAAGRV